MKKKIYNFLDNEKKYISTIAKEIAETFRDEANNENIDYSFTIERQTGLIQDQDANTYFMFDTTEDTILHEFKKALFDEDLSNIQQDSKEEKILMNDVRNFLLKVGKRIIKSHNKKIKETVRRIILGNKVNSITVPLNNIQIISIDIADYSSIPESSKYLLKIGKKANTDVNTDEIIKFIHNRQEKTGMDIDTIFSIEKKAGNPMFENVLIIEKGRKFLNEVAIYFFIDYSLKSS